MNLATKVTLGRILLIPVLVAVLLSNFEWKWFCSLDILILASLSDWFDGKIARKKFQVTEFGKFLDPLADKIFVLSVFLCFIELKILNAVPVILIIAREFFITALRFDAVLNKEVIPANNFGKVKTSLQMFYISLVLAFCHYNLGSWWIFSIFVNTGIWIVVAISIISLVSYVTQNKNFLSFSRH
ncbi:MAG: CDP-diacylglycerol--glycerol-3-phosphate 3-phosphatidyltransferase [Oscillospiraceae bacterium]|jgi:CDP-diacylglycerol--glycerol-3-phosphate 3-phosphatidyltransferase|nr:CDP-diacylglycerol--glycerol-3-phosphate 3-phosphatidyltransferase [Oscillospiraceae bacterium]